MTGPRTQFETVYRPLVGPLFSTDGFQEIRREPIPWCTTHNHQSTQRPGNESGVDCLAGIIKEGLCRISTGGPDHKWWVDQ